MKANSRVEHRILGRVVEISKIVNGFYVWIDGEPLKNPYEQLQAKFSTVIRAKRAAKMAIARERRGFIV